MRLTVLILALLFYTIWVILVSIQLDSAIKDELKTDVPIEHQFTQQELDSIEIVNDFNAIFIKEDTLLN